MTILLIDDSTPVREVLRVALESEGYRVLEAADGREGVKIDTADLEQARVQEASRGMLGLLMISFRRVIACPTILTLHS